MILWAMAHVLYRKKIALFPNKINGSYTQGDSNLIGQAGRAGKLQA